MPPEVEPLDLHRMFIGDLSWTFLLEVAFRTAFMYVYTFALVRFVAQRTIGQLSLPEFLIVIALGSAVGDPMFYPEVPLLHGMVVIAVVVAVNAAVNRFITRFEFVELAIEGKPQQLMRDGKLDLEGMQGAGLAREEFFEQLRLKGIAHLGQVRAAYLEQGGAVSIFQTPTAGPRRGLAIEPPEDLIEADYSRSGSPVALDGYFACVRDGTVVELKAGDRFPICECGGTEWEPATED